MAPPLTPVAGQASTTLAAAAHRFRCHAEAALQPLKLTFRQFLVLASVGADHPSPAIFAGLDETSIATTMHVLAARGLLAGGLGKLSADGERVLHEARELVAAADRQSLSRLGEHEAHFFEVTLGKLTSTTAP